ISRRPSHCSPCVNGARRLRAAASVGPPGAWSRACPQTSRFDATARSTEAVYPGVAPGAHEAAAPPGDAVAPTTRAAAPANANIPNQRIDLEVSRLGSGLDGELAS